MHTAPGACSKYAPGAVCIQIMLLEHFNLEYSSRLFVVLDHMVQEQLVLDHKARPKSPKSQETWMMTLEMTQLQKKKKKLFPEGRECIVLSLRIAAFHFLIAFKK